MAAPFFLRIAFFVVVFSPVFRAETRPRPTETFMYDAVLDGGNNFYLYWSFDETNITFEVHVRSKGWVGFGLSPTGSMKGADVVVGWIKDGQVHFKDRHTRGHETPPVDDSQDYELLHAEENENFTVFKFRRRLDTCDEDDFKIEVIHSQEGTARLIYAWHKNDPKSEDIPMSYHRANRGTRSLTLLDYTVLRDGRSVGEDEYPYFETLMGNISIPEAPTTYWCKFFRLPDFRAKHHIVKIEPRMDQSVLGLVHHIVVYTCEQEMTDIESSEGEPCYLKMLMPPNVTACDSVIFAYAVGMEAFTFPDHVGYPIGRKEDPRYFYLEVHYDNPHQMRGIRDNSGLRFYYSPHPRQHDAGVLEFGHTVWFPPMIIPPGARAFRVDNYCSKDCTGQYIPETGIRLIGALLHAHLAGHRMWIKHVRNGTELNEISRDDHYDFNYQQFRRFSREVVVLPGDELINTCEFRTNQRSKVTYGGLSTKEEMCFNFVMYYPRIELTKCLSTVYNLDKLSNYIHNKLRRGDLQYRSRGPFQYLEDIRWNKREIRRFHRTMFRADTYREYCERRGNGAGPMVNRHFEERPVIRIKRRLRKSKTCRRRPRNVYDLLTRSRASSVESDSALFRAVYFMFTIVSLRLPT